MKVELTRFRVIGDQTKMVDEWLSFLNNNMKDVLLTLEDEKMYVETIFRETLEGNEYLYWFSVQGEGGQEVEESENWIDKIHLQYWKKCIDTDFGPVDLTPEVVMIPEKIRKSMES